MIGRIASMQTWPTIRRKIHHKPKMNQGRMLRTEGGVLDTGKIGQYISDVYNIIMVTQMEHQAMY
jgi:hypothetical protein